MALFNKKNKDEKKSGENIIGKIIYMFLLFAPLLSILTTSMYAIFNKNAFESYYGETINERIETKVDISNLEQNKRYIFKQKEYSETVQGANATLYVENVVSIDGTIGATGTPDYPLTEVNAILVYMPTANRITYEFRKTNGTGGYYSKNALLNGTFTYFSFEYTYLGRNNDTSTNWNYFNTNYEITYNKYSYLDNNFDYGIYKTEQNNLFNWSKTTGMYQVMQTTTSQLGITNTFTPMLLTYWLVISVIYFIYDIALMLVWILHRKIHELTESV